MSDEDNVLRLYEALSIDMGFDLIDRSLHEIVSKWTTLLFKRGRDRKLPELRLQLLTQPGIGYIVAINSFPAEDLYHFNINKAVKSEELILNLVIGYMHSVREGKKYYGPD